MRRHQSWLLVVLVGAIVGTVFAAVSTYDFVQHLDRQVHSLHCSFIPGVSHAGESGCQVAMMSPYSSLFRSQVWGGVPIALPAMSVFAFLVFFTLDLMVTRRKDDPRATGFLALATVLPAAASLVMLVISLTQLGTTCKLCVCIYLASAACLIGSIAVWRHAVRGGGGGVAEPPPGRSDDPAFVGRAKTAPGARLVAVGGTEPARPGFLAAAFAIGVAFVAVPVVLYLAMAPDHARFIGTCEGLSHPEDSYGVMLRIDRGGPGGAPAIEVLDPLCPACKAFEQRLAASGLASRLDRKAVLFPLDNTCNWMVTEATHPGACTVSEAVLCAGDQAPEVIAWAFEVQDRIRSETRADPGAAARIVKQRFPKLAACVGSPEARSRLNKSLRWIVANNIRVLTPQLYIDNVKLCDEDVDLGLEYMLSNMLDRHAAGKLAAVPLEKAASPGDPARPAGTDADRAPSKASADPVPADRTPADKPPADKPPADRPAVDTPAADKASGNPPAGRPADQAGGPVRDPSEVSGTGGKKAPAPAAEPPRPAEPAAPATGRPAERSETPGDQPAPVAPPQPAPTPGDKPTDKTRRDIDLPSAEQPKPPGGNP